MECEHDQTFLQILREEKNIVNFLDSFFGFLCRCTDFYVELSPEQRLGFPPGIVENLVLNSLNKWKKIAQQSSVPKTNQEIKNSTSENKDENDFQYSEDCIELPSVVQEVEVAICKDQGTVERKRSQPVTKKLPPAKDKSSDSYNGAIRENYTWSQTISDLDVLVKLPTDIEIAKDLKVDLGSQKIKIDTRTTIIQTDKDSNLCNEKEWTTIFDGELVFKIKKDESVWSIIPGQYISIHLEKASKSWWEALIVGEPKIELNKIDCSQNLDELESAEQMKIQELIWNQQQKLQGKPTSDQLKMEQILKKAWNAEGSPFGGTPYDPSILKFD